MRKILSILLGLVALCGLAQNPDPRVYIRFGDAKSGTLIVTNADYFASADDLYTVTTNMNAVLVPITNDIFGIKLEMSVVTQKIGHIEQELELTEVYSGTNVIGYVLGSQTNKVIQPAGMQPDMSAYMPKSGGTFSGPVSFSYDYYGAPTTWLTAGYNNGPRIHLSEALQILSNHNSLTLSDTLLQASEIWVYDTNTGATQFIRPDKLVLSTGGSMISADVFLGLLEDTPQLSSVGAIAANTVVSPILKETPDSSTYLSLDSTEATFHNSSLLVDYGIITDFGGSYDMFSNRTLINAAYARDYEGSYLDGVFIEKQPDDSFDIVEDVVTLGE